MNAELDARETLAAEYALGSLSRKDRRQAQKLFEKDPAFARMVEDWQERLSPMADLIEPVEPPDEAWDRIARMLGPEPRIAPIAMAAKDTAAVTERDGRSLLQSLAFWRWTTAATGALAAASIALLLTLGGGWEPATLAGDRLVAVLSDGEAEPALIATIDRASHHMTIRPLMATSRNDRSLEIWLVADGALPHSLGLLDETGETNLQLSAQLEEAVSSAARLAISLEPEGGSPSGRPTGPVIYSAPLLSVDK